jgi:membrane protease YdiL (CAAX protease family)
VVALPHRFATGLVLGWLRERSGSLAPSITAHFVNNALAVAWAAGGD